MATVKRFEDLDIWQLARTLAKDIRSLTLQQNFQHEFKLKEQIKGSSGSIMDNIAEGFGRGSRFEFVQFLSFSKGSADELKSQLYRMYDSDLIKKKFLNCTMKRLMFWGQNFFFHGRFEFN